MTITSIRLPESLLNFIENRSENTNQSKSKIIIEALLHYKNEFELSYFKSSDPRSIKITMGRFTERKNGEIEGVIHTLSFEIPIKIIPLQNPSGAEWDYNIINSNLHTIGAGWIKKDAYDETYIDILMDDPTIAKPIHAVMYKASKLNYVMNWKRP